MGGDREEVTGPPGRFSPACWGGPRVLLLSGWVRPQEKHLWNEEMANRLALFSGKEWTQNGCQGFSEGGGGSVSVSLSVCVETLRVPSWLQ